MGQLTVAVLVSVGVLVIATSLISAATNQQKVVCYHSNWSRYRWGDGKFEESNVDPFLCTHLIYAFGVFDESGIVTAHEGTGEHPRLQNFNNLKLQNPDLKTLLAIGGWNFGSIVFSEMAHDQVKRMNFVTSSLTFLREHGFDGLDIDWEYPAQRGGSTIYDKENLVTLCEELVIAFKAEAVRTGNEQLLLTIAVPAGRSYIQAGYNVPELNKYIDFFNLMTYDFHGGWETKTGHNSPLYASDYDEGDYRYYNTNDTAAYWHAIGVPKEKVIVGLATYGRTFTLTSQQTGLNAAASAGPAGKYTGENGFMAYYEICTEIQTNSGQVVFDNQMQVPYFVKDNLWIGYDNEESMRRKAEMIVENQYGGMMVWAIALDDFQPICSTSKFPLIKAAKNVLLASGGIIAPSPASTTTTTATPKPASSITTSKPATTTSATAGATNPPSSSSGFSCENRLDDNYPVPGNCSVFIKCAGGTAYEYACPNDLLYDANTKTCNWSHDVNCTQTVSK